MIFQTKRNIGDYVVVNVIERGDNDILDYQVIQKSVKIYQIIFFKGGFLYKTEAGAYPEEDVFDDEASAKRVANEYFDKNICFH